MSNVFASTCQGTKRSSHCPLASLVMTCIYVDVLGRKFLLLSPPVPTASFVSSCFIGLFLVSSAYPSAVTLLLCTLCLATDHDALLPGQSLCQVNHRVNAHTTTVLFLAIYRHFDRRNIRFSPQSLSSFAPCKGHIKHCSSDFVKYPDRCTYICVAEKYRVN